MASKRSFLQQIQRNTHLMSRTAGDLSAFQRGTLGKRLVRRKITRSGIGPILSRLFR